MGSPVTDKILSVALSLSHGLIVEDEQFCGEPPDGASGASGDPARQSRLTSGSGERS